MNPWEKPGLTVEERALVVYPEVTGSTVIGVRGCTAIVEALTAAVEQERERCRVVAMTRRVELLEAATEFNVRGWNRKAREYEMRADAAYEIATRIAGEENQE